MIQILKQCLMIGNPPVTELTTKAYKFYSYRLIILNSLQHFPDTIFRLNPEFPATISQKHIKPMDSEMRLQHCVKITNMSKTSET
jgi:hypothetical protein